MSEFVESLDHVEGKRDLDQLLKVWLLANAVVPRNFTNGQLIPHIHVTPPADLLQVFDCVYDPPASPGDGSRIGTDIEYNGAIEDWAVGVRIQSASNALELKLPKASGGKA